MEMKKLKLKRTKPTLTLFSRFLAAIPLVTGLAGAGSASAAPYLHAPSVETYARHDPQGLTILSSGRYLKPAGRHTPVARFPFGLAMSRDGRTLFVASSGLGQLIADWRDPKPRVTELHPPGEGRKKRSWSGGGADFSPDGGTLYWSGGDSGAVHVFDVESGRLTAEITLNSTVDDRKYEDSYAVDLKMSEEGRVLYCADVTNFRLAVVDVEMQRVIGSVQVGRYPYALAVVGPRVYVANIGLFEYSPIPPPSDDRFDKRGLSFPPFGYPSREARDGVEVEARRIPGLGEPNVPESFSVWGVDVANPAQPKVASRLKTGLLIGATSDNGQTVGGSAPNFLVAQGGALFVSNGNNDLIERIDLARNQIVTTRRLIPSPLVSRLRGVGPSGMAVSSEGRRLFVAESGLNALAVLDAKTLTVLGHIPTGWYPYRVALSPDGRQLVCICFRGFGNGPNAGSRVPKSDFLGMRGVVSVLDVPSDTKLKAMTADVLACNGIPFRNYGEGFEFPGVEEGADMHPTGAREVVNIPMSKVLFDNTCREFPIFNMNIPDQYRAHWFMRDVETRFLRGKKPFPSFVNIALSSDHGSSPRPEKGYPYLASWMADNDLALGRIVEFLTHTPYWKNMAIFVTQDDSGGEPDHVDAQRSVLMVISPWAKRGYVSHRHTTIVSMHRTLYQILGLPPLNMFDALANDFSDCFTTEPEFRPYQCRPVDPRIFDPEKAKDPNDPDYGKARLLPSIPMDDPEEMEDNLRRGEREVRPR